MGALLALMTTVPSPVTEFSILPIPLSAQHVCQASTMTLSTEDVYCAGSTRSQSMEFAKTVIRSTRTGQPLSTLLVVATSVLIPGRWCNANLALTVITKKALHVSSALTMTHCALYVTWIQFIMFMVARAIKLNSSTRLCSFPATSAKMDTSTMKT